MQNLQGAGYKLAPHRILHIKLQQEFLWQKNLSTNHRKSHTSRCRAFRESLPTGHTRTVFSESFTAERTSGAEDGSCHFTTQSAEKITRTSMTSESRQSKVWFTSRWKMTCRFFSTHKWISSSIRARSIQTCHSEGWCISVNSTRTRSKDRRKTSSAVRW